MNFWKISDIFIFIIQEDAINALLEMSIFIKGHDGDFNTYIKNIFFDQQKVK